MNRTEKIWDRFAKNYDNPVEPGGEAHKIVVKTKAYLNSSDFVLDYGCATGSITNAFSGDVEQILGIDISVQMIERARRKASELKIENIHYEKASIFDEKLEGKTFDVIFAFNILHLLDDVNSVVQRIHALLKPEGTFVSVTACMGEEKRMLGIFLSVLSKIGVVPNLKILKISEIEEFIETGYFQIIESESLGHEAPSHYVAAKKISKDPGTTGSN